MAPNQPPPNLSADTWPSSIFLLRKHHIAKNKNVSDGALTQPPPNLTANMTLYNIFIEQQTKNIIVNNQK